MQPKLHLLICSTSPAPTISAIAHWLHAAAVAHGIFSVELIDLCDFPAHRPDASRATTQARQAQLHRWSESIERADAFVFVMSEHEQVSPALLSALEDLPGEWRFKSVGIVMHGNSSASIQTVRVIEQAVTKLHMEPLLDGVHLSIHHPQIGVDGAFHAEAQQRRLIPPMLDELHHLATTLLPLRDPFNDRTRERLMKMEQRRCAALMEKDILSLNNILAVDLVHVHANGRVDSRATYLDYVQSDVEFLEVRRGGLRVTVDGAAALMSGLQTSIVKLPGDVEAGRRIDAFVVQYWSLREARWQQVSFQATTLPSSSEFSFG